MLGFEDEATAFVEIDAPTGGSAVGMMLGDFKFKRVSLIAGRAGVGKAEEIAEFGEKKLAVGAFGGAGGGPAVDERSGGVGGHGHYKYYRMG